MAVTKGARSKKGLNRAKATKKRKKAKKQKLVEGKCPEESAQEISKMLSTFDKVAVIRSSSRINSVTATAFWLYPFLILLFETEITHLSHFVAKMT